MTVRVDYSRRALAQLEDLYRYIADTDGPRRAEAFVASVKHHCDGFSTFPHRGMQRDDLRPGLRIVGFRRRATIALTVDDDAVVILGVFYGGQNFETLLRDEDEG